MEQPRRRQQKSISTGGGSRTKENSFKSKARICDWSVFRWSVELLTTYLDCQSQRPRVGGVNTNSVLMMDGIGGS